MSKIAVIASGGKQYKVKEGDTIKLEKLDIASGQKFKLDTLLIAEVDGSSVELGTPSLGERVEAEVIDTTKQDKVTVVKYKNKTRYKKTTGHRQFKTSVKVLKIA
ncbi:MAG: 50S ribosomal protein L21 [Clostridia bacterium]|nr:50S ribosomal protein L21 [Clostridia bacterium]